MIWGTASCITAHRLGLLKILDCQHRSELLVKPSLSTRVWFNGRM